jgi:predicted esterase
MRTTHSFVGSVLLVTSVVALFGCSGSSRSEPSDAGVRLDGSSPRVDAGTDSGASPDAGELRDAGSTPDAASVASRDVRCGDPAPAGAVLPPSLPSYSGGTCPTLVPGRNVLRSGPVDRELLVVVPAGYDPATERLPVVFMWHYLGGSANSMLTHGQAQESADALRFIAVIPEKLGDLAITIPFAGAFDPAWPYLESASETRVEQELTFFDDMLACIASTYAIDESCVSTVGVSAGALWTAQLLQRRSERLASAILMSGGIGPATSGLGAGLGLEVRGWTGATHAMPVLVGWGGPSDQCGLAFERASTNLESHLGDHFVEECVHNCGHAVPPVDATVGLRVLWGFALDHPYWLWECDPAHGSVRAYRGRRRPVVLPCARTLSSHPRDAVQVHGSTTS